MTAKRDRGIKKYVRRMNREARKARAREQGSHDRCSPAAEFRAELYAELNGIRQSIESELMREFYAPVVFEEPTLRVRIKLPEAP